MLCGNNFGQQRKGIMTSFGIKGFRATLKNLKILNLFPVQPKSLITTITDLQI